MNKDPSYDKVAAFSAEFTAHRGTLEPETWFSHETFRYHVLRKWIQDGVLNNTFRCLVDIFQFLRKNFSGVMSISVS